MGVMLAPQRARSLVSFLDKWKYDVVDARRPKLFMFEHVHGARVYDGWALTREGGGHAPAFQQPT